MWTYLTGTLSVGVVIHNVEPLNVDMFKTSTNCPDYQGVLNSEVN